MKTYRFKLYLTSNGQTNEQFHSLRSTSFKKAYLQVLEETPHNYPCDFFYVSATYSVNGKRRYI